MMRNNSLLIAFVFFFTYSYGQKQHLYYNEKYQRIEKSVFEQKLTSKLFQIASFENDTAKIYKLRYVSFFGKIDSIKNKQLRERLSQLYSLNPDECWFIHYIPSLPDPKKMSPEEGIIYIDTTAKDSIFVPTKRRKSSISFDRKKYNYRYHTTSLKSYQEAIERWSNAMSSKVNFFHLYGSDNGFPVNFSETIRLFKDPKNIVRRVFNDGQVPYGVIILHPTGDFFVSVPDNKKQQMKVIKLKGYFKEKEKWLKRIAN